MNRVTQESYNLPGYGLISYRLFPYARSIFNFLDKFGHIKRLRETDQLGALRGAFPGAHHNRYEYVIAQLAIITELCKLKGPQPSGITLSSQTDQFGVLPKHNDSPSWGEVLQCLVLLSNIGHLPSTFAGERALLSHLRSEASKRRAFRSGFPSEDRELVDSVCSNYDLYRFHYLLAIFLLNRYRRAENGHATVEFCNALMRDYLGSRLDKNGPERSQWILFRNIRRLTYISLDSLYTPVPFSLELASIFLAIEENLKTVFGEASEFQLALRQLEGVLKDTVYLSPAALFQLSEVTRRTLLKLEEEDLGTITEFRHMLEPSDNEPSEGGVFWSPLRNSPLEGTNSALTVVVNYKCDPKVAPSLLEEFESDEEDDPVAWERAARRRVGIKATRFGAEWDPTYSHLRAAAALAEVPDDGDGVWRGFRIVKQLADLEIGARERTGEGSQARWANGQALLHFLCALVFGPNRRYRFPVPPVRDMNPVFIEYGSTKTARLVDRYTISLKGLVDADTTNEMEILARTLAKIDYRGLLVAFAGGTEVLSEQRSIAEFDGLVFLLGRARNIDQVLIVEGKNQPQGHTAARRQLNNRLGDVGAGTGTWQVTELPTKGAFASLPIAEAPAIS